MKSAFTMIELIFVIVILGILSAVAIPKLSATRDDAMISKAAHIISTSATEVQSYAASQGSVNQDLSTMSNLILGAVVQNEATLDIVNSLVDFKMGSRDDCITMAVVGVTDMNLTLTFGAPGDALCDSLQGMFDTSVNVMPLRGEYVVR